MKAVIASTILLVAICLPRPAISFAWTNFVRNRVNRENVVSPSQCETYANQGSCRFYDCYNELERICLNKPDWTLHTVEIWCFNSKFLGFQGRFSRTAIDYLDKVRTCQTKRLVDVRYLDNPNTRCSNINSLATYALVGIEQGDINSYDCYWQDKQFCEVIKNPTDNVALIESILGDANDGGVLRIKRAQVTHIRYLKRFCPQDAQDIFKESFVPLIPPGNGYKPIDYDFFE
ncbi:hypothetical protein SNE40_013940 [Patella caerulea]|uniref:Uncharacterized protein n=1 Tax=Patella caerulea TaxID=87958 RepID=A0AAN8PPQ4_PATCE